MLLLREFSIPITLVIRNGQDLCRTQEVGLLAVLRAMLLSLNRLLLDTFQLNRCYNAVFISFTVHS